MDVLGQGATPPRDTRDEEAGRRVVARAMRVGMWAWPSFLALDAWMCFVAYPGAPFARFALYRAIVLLAFVAVYVASGRTTVPLLRLYKWQNISFGAAAVAISLMAVDLGGVRSPYMHGISLVALVRAVVVPTHWRHSLRAYGRIGLAFPLVMGMGALLSPAARAEWVTPEALTWFVSNYIFVVASALLGLLAAHLVWTAQQQLYQARRLGRYRLQAPIGKGGMGEVWLAWDCNLNRNVALKILRMAEAPSPDALKRFEREAHSAGQLRGQHSVRIFDYGASDDGLYYIAMEYLPGMDLGTMVERYGPLPRARAVRAVMQACLALEEAHAAGIIHRDIKPHNLFMTRVGDDADFIKLVDFGIVRLRAPEPTIGELTWTGIVVGTPAYMAPELLEGAPADERSDIYALGVTLHVLITGKSPFEGFPGNRLPPDSDLHAVYALRHPRADKANPLTEIIFKCIARNPADRLQSARALRKALVSLPDLEWSRHDADEFWHTAERSVFG